MTGTGDGETDPMPAPDKDKRIAQDADDGDLLVLCGGKMTLEGIVDSTGEFEHLNELIQLTIDRCGGFRDTAEYFKTVTPILDLLEVEIRIRYRDGMTRKQMKLVIQDWIDKEIAGLR